MSYVMPSKPTIAVLGLGYVGLPLATAFSSHYRTVGFDINTQRIDELKQFFDRTEEVSEVDLRTATALTFTNDATQLGAADVLIVTVPTPVDKDKRPNLEPLYKASRLIGEVIKPNTVVIYESTVFPGATEEECVPIIEKTSGLVFNQDFYAAYSPERINPGDKGHKITDIIKVTSGSTPAVADAIDQLYASVISAGTHKAPSIKVAEAAKVIENTQRDLNIALINELAMIFNRMDIDTADVLAAAGSKWNFLPFKPGLVGGHCIGVDPYYLTHKAERVGYRPEVILAGRRINDRMSHYVVGRVVKLMIKKHIDVSSARILVMGLTFKENCPDVRNSKVVDVVHEFKDYGATVDVFDPVADPEAAIQQHQITLVSSLSNTVYDAVVVAVAHDEIVSFCQSDLSPILKKASVVYDVKNVLAATQYDERL